MVIGYGMVTFEEMLGKDSGLEISGSVTFKGKLFGYARVSTIHQSLDIQVDALVKYGVPIENIHKEKISGVKDDRKELDRVLDKLREGDTLVIYKLDRLARSLKRLLEILDDLHKRNVELVSISNDLDTTTPMGKMMFQLIGMFAEFERNVIVDRTQEGLQAARARGIVGGRPKSDAKKIEHALRLYDTKEFTVPEIMEQTGVKKTTLYKAINERKG